MTIEFYYMPESPPCRAVEMLASVIGVDLEKRCIDLSKGEHMKEDFVKMNPQHKLPFIVDRDFKLGESRAILAYLVNKYKPDDTNLYPRDPEARAKIDELLYYDIGILYSSLSNLCKPIISGSAKKLDEDSIKVLKDNLHYLDSRLGQEPTRKFMLGDQLTIADISLAASLSFMFCFRIDLAEFKNIATYNHRLEKAIPNYDEINTKPIENTKKWLDAKMQQN